MSWPGAVAQGTRTMAYCHGGHAVGSPTSLDQGWRPCRLTARRAEDWKADEGNLADALKDFKPAEAQQRRAVSEMGGISYKGTAHQREGRIGSQEESVVCSPVCAHVVACRELLERGRQLLADLFELERGHLVRLFRLGDRTLLLLHQLLIKLLRLHHGQIELGLLCQLDALQLAQLIARTEEEKPV